MSESDSEESCNDGVGAILPIQKQDVHRIVSGQVIADMASAVKELVDNALDSGATSINSESKKMKSVKHLHVSIYISTQFSNYSSLHVKYEYSIHAFLFFLLSNFFKPMCKKSPIVQSRLRCHRSK